MWSLNLKKLQYYQGLVKKYKGWDGAFGNVVDKNIYGPPPPFGTKMTDPALQQG